ncbi:hypothetical protein IRA69_06435 [Campylobacter hepaticus]|nr:hypothetical protein IRA69_06435 [Campylobacter hepaticus]
MDLILLAIPQIHQVLPFYAAPLIIFINTGIISGVIGVNLSGDISTFINTGFIRSTDSTSEQRAAINLFNTDGKAPNIDYLINAGTLDSQSQGILITAGSTINNLFNTGTIKAQKDGITFISENNTQNDIKIGKIILTKDSSIDATQKRYQCKFSTK